MKIFDLKKEKDWDFPEMGIAVISSLASQNLSNNEDNMALLADRLQVSWKIGSKPKGTGLFLLISIQDRKLRLNTTGEMKKIISDSYAKSFLDNNKA